MGDRKPASHFFCYIYKSNRFINFFKFYTA